MCSFIVMTIVDVISVVSTHVVLDLSGMMSGALYLAANFIIPKIRLLGSVAQEPNRNPGTRTVRTAAPGDNSRTGTAAAGSQDLKPEPAPLLAGKAVQRSVQKEHWNSSSCSMHKLLLAF